MRTFASFAILLCNKKVYMVQEDDDTWGFPGGGIDPGETPKDAMHRELWEETDGLARIEPSLEPKEVLDISVEQNDGVTGFVYLLDSDKTCPSCKNLNNGETQECRWVPIDEFPKTNLRAPLRKNRFKLYMLMRVYTDSA